MKLLSLIWLVALIFMLGCSQEESSVSSLNSDRVYFSKHVVVFGIDVYATAKTGDDKIIHAANVLAEYLDNDEDGVPNDPEVVNYLLSDNSALLMTETENEMERIDWDSVPDHGFGQGLYDEETHPVTMDAKFSNIFIGL